VHQLVNKQNFDRTFALPGYFAAFIGSWLGTLGVAVTPLHVRTVLMQILILFSKTTH